MRSLRSYSLPLSTAAIALSLACASSHKPGTSEPKEAPTAPKPKEVRDPRYLSLPTPGPAPDWAPPAANRITLENGLSVWQMKHGVTPLVSIHLVLPTGAALDPPNKAGLALLTADMLDEGAGKYSALQLNERLGELATDYSSSAGVDYILLSMEALSENLEESLEILGDIVMRPQLTKTEFERRKQHHLAEAVSNQDDQDAARSNALSRVLFSQNYAGLPPGGTEKTLSEITWDDVKKHARALAIPDGAHLVVAGMTDETKTLDVVKKFLGKWKGKRKPTELRVAEPQKGGRAYLIDFPGAAQSSLAIATRAGSNADPNHLAEEVMNQKLGESFTGRINMNLRRKGLHLWSLQSISPLPEGRLLCCRLQCEERNNWRQRARSIEGIQRALFFSTSHRRGTQRIRRWPPARLPDDFR
jgi:zinc protease